MLKVYYLITFLINYLVPLVLKFRLLKKKEDPDRYKEKLGKYIKNTPDEYIWFHACLRIKIYRKTYQNTNV